MTSARKAGDNSEEERPAEAAEGQVEGDQPERSSPAGPADAKFTDTVDNASIDAEGADAAGVDADLDALLADVQRERDEYLDLARRAKADFENYRKRAAKDADEAERRGKASLARQLPPVLDNLERALKAADEDSELARGVALVRAELEETLKRAGVEAYDPRGERFDPTWHEALSTQPADGTESGIVVETLERGYRLDGQVLRPARVVVSQ
jgi:molecular chaperone GrpE